MSEPIIKAENLSVIYNQSKPNEVRALLNVNLEIFPNEYLIIHGPSGCGKSTLLYSLAGLQMPTKGEITIEGKPLSKMTKKEKVLFHQKSIGMIFQSFYLIPSLNIIDNVCLPQMFLGENIRKRREQGMKLLERFGIAEQAYKFSSQLSGGQKQRVAIARSLINNPSIILADEPVGNLDSESSLNVMKIIKELNEVDKKTIILVTHNAEHLHYGDRIVSVRDGKILSEEINKEKRPPEAAKREKSFLEEEITPELRVLMRAFKNLTPQQIGALFVPYKSRQLLFHILFGYTEEQIDVADKTLKEFLFKNINSSEMKNTLDKGFGEGGANWDKRRAEFFARRVDQIFYQVNFIKENPEKAPEELSEYLIKLFEMEIDPATKQRFTSLLKMRIENRIDFLGLKEKFDAARIMGGLGLYKNTVERIVKEIEIIMLMSYSP